jgi:hypothetical protein
MAEATKMTFFTPSYRGDLERFALLRESIKRFYCGSARHVVAVPKEDVSLFRRVAGDVEIVSQNDFVEPYFYPTKWYLLIKKAFTSQVWRFQAYAGRSGWIIQQIVKMNLPDIVGDGVVALMDSDLVFIRSFHDSDFDVGGDKRLLLRDEPTTESGKHREYMITARRILGLPDGCTDHHYIAHPTIWYPDWAMKLRKHIENVHGKPWQMVLFEASALSEYCLYGLFVEEILKPTDLKIRLEPFHYSIWDQRSYDRLVSGEFMTAENTKTICAVIQSNLQIPVDHYRASLKALYGLDS